MPTPWAALGLVSLYLLIIMVGPKLMKKREAFRINQLLLVYNFGLILLSLYMFFEVGHALEKFTKHFFHYEISSTIFLKIF
jgi:hypothetical protein